jgi:ArsR family transcriptional regulator
MASSNLVELSAGPVSQRAQPVQSGQEAALLATAADPLRWRVLRHLSTGEACVCELQEFAPVAGSLLSYHLRVLREAGLVQATRRGRWVHYRLAPDAAERLRAALPLDPFFTGGRTGTDGAIR